MSENKLTPDQLQALLKYVSTKLGTTPDELVNSVSEKGAESMASRLSPANAARFQALVSDKNKLEQMLNSPQAQQIIETLLKNKNK